MKKSVIRKYQRSDTLWSSILGSAICMMEHVELGLLLLLKINSIVGIARRPIISREVHPVKYASGICLKRYIIL
ncbi:MAG: hypothetical protein V3S72_10780 [Desulfobacterales bacterium]